MTWPPDQGGDVALWVGNARARLTCVEAAGKSWPVSLSEPDRREEATWLTSLLSAVIGTPRDEISADALTLKGQATVSALRVLEALAHLAGLDRCAMVNNTLMSVSPIGTSQLAGLGEAVRSAAERWPDRVAVARGIVCEAENVLALARRIGAFAVPNRVSYAYDLTGGRTPEKINAQRDFTLLAKAGLEVVAPAGFSADDLAQAHAQYFSVYVGRHGRRNPQFTQRFFADIHQAGATEFWGLRRGGALVAFVALRDHGEFLSVPLIGYDTAADKKLGYYRQIFALALRVAAERRRVINFGAGAGQYKKLRGAVVALEYMLICPPRSGALGRVLGLVLRAAEEPLGRGIPKAILAYGG